jgi:hypothetical protein
MEEEVELPDVCPQCHTSYDEIDYEYQICHLCGYDNNKDEFIQE